MKAYVSRGSLYALPLSLLTLVPLAVVLSSFLQPQPEIWAHLTEHVLSEVLGNTLVLIAGVGFGVLALGVPLAWLTAVCEFPGRRFFAWTLVLPLAMPAYVLAFVLVGLFDYSGPIQTWLRESAGYAGGLPEIRSASGVLLTLTLALYPYVYLLAREAFLSQGRRAMEAAQSLGLTRRQAFWRIALPMARPWLAGGLMLALMESLADFGTVAIFNFDTFTTAVYKAWFALFNLQAATQLASLLVLFVLVIAWLEARSRRGQRFHDKGGRGARITLHGWRRWFASGFCLAVLMLAFVIPMLQLLRWSIKVWAEDADARYWGFVSHSLMLSAMTAVIVAVVALLLTHLARRFPDPGTQWLKRLAALGYAIPGTVLAVGVFIPISWLDNLLISGASSLGKPATQILQGTVAAMLLALTTRFLAVGHQPIEAAMHRVTRDQEDAARSLGIAGRTLFWRLHLPMLRGGILSGVLLVFVETLKEMPITLMTRPFGWDTLAVRVFEMTSEGMWENAALPGVCIVIAGLMPVLLLVRETEK
jgi:iron(III) transport system permease protein